MAPTLLTRAALPHLRDRRGAVVNVSSTFGHRPRRRVPPTETQILAQSGLTAEAIEAIKADEVRRIPLGRRGHPDDVARWIVTLADPAADWITGQVITVDGGLDLVA